MKRVLITGIKGFTGRYLAEVLAQHGWDVCGIGAQPATGESNYRQVDLLDEEGLRQALAEWQPDAVAHLAGIAFVGHGDADAFYRVNLLGTRHLLAALADAPKRPSCVLLASSANVYGNSMAGVLNEASPVSPANDYAVSKLAMEHMARLWLDKLPVVIARPFNYTGVGQAESFLLPKIVAHFRRGADAIELGNLDVWRDFSDVRAVTQAYRDLLEMAPAGETVNVCSGHTHSLREVVAMAEGISGRRMQVQVNPAFVRANEVKTLCGDPGKLRGIVGSTWQTPPLAETLRWMLEAP